MQWNKFGLKNSFSGDKGFWHNTFCWITLWKSVLVDMKSEQKRGTLTSSMTSLEEKKLVLYLKGLLVIFVMKIWNLQHKEWKIVYNPLTHGLFEVRYLTACGLNCPQICGRICPWPWEMGYSKRNWWFLALVDLKVTKNAVIYSKLLNKIYSQDGFVT
jgi:hypothetical protein